MIESISIANFKNIKLQNIDFSSRLTIFVGANGSGKTSVLEAVHLAVLARFVEADELFSGKRHCDWLYTRGGEGAMSLVCKSGSGTFEIVASPPKRFTPRFEDMGVRAWKFRIDSNRLDIDLLGIAKSASLFHLESAKLIAPSYTKTVPPRLEEDGENLPSVLAFMALNDPDGFSALSKYLKRLIPRLDRIRFSKEQVTRSQTEILKIGDSIVERPQQQNYLGDSILFDYLNAKDVAAHSVSEGTILILGLLAILLQPGRPDIILLDDLERGLHPLAQKEVLKVLNLIMELFPDLQIIATAHSPYLLDQLEPEQIRLMATNDAGYSVCGKLTDHPHFESWKDEMAPGELWSLFGEQWVSEVEAAK